MQVVGGATLAIIVVADFAQQIALMHQLAADNSIGIKLAWIHMHVTHTHMGARCINEEIHSFLLACAQNKSVMSSHNVMLIRQATVRAVVE